jgi:hypothetical protein
MKYEEKKPVCIHIPAGKHIPLLNKRGSKPATDRSIELLTAPYYLRNIGY